MLGFFLAFLTAVLESLRAVLSKKQTQHLDAFTIAWAFRFFTFILLLPLLFLFPIPQTDGTFWLAFVGAVIVNAFASILYLQALKHSDLSKVGPLITFTPLFMLILSPLLVSEYPSFVGILGVLLIVIGAYITHTKGAQAGNHQNLLDPLLSIVREKGSRYMLIVAFLFSIGSNLDKIAITHSSVWFWAVVFNAGVTLVLLPVMFKPSARHAFTLNWKPLLLIGIVTAVGLLAQYTALTLMLVVYVIAIKRLAALFAVFWGLLIFREKFGVQRWIGALLMVGGVILITLA